MEEIIDRGSTPVGTSDHPETQKNRDCTHGAGHRPYIRGLLSLVQCINKLERLRKTERPLVGTQHVTSP